MLSVFLLRWPGRFLCQLTQIDIYPQTPCSLPDLLHLLPAPAHGLSSSEEGEEGGERGGGAREGEAREGGGGWQEGGEGGGGGGQQPLTCVDPVALFRDQVDVLVLTWEM